MVKAAGPGDGNFCESEDSENEPTNQNTQP